MKKYFIPYVVLLMAIALASCSKSKAINEETPLAGTEWFGTTDEVSFRLNF